MLVLILITGICMFVRTNVILFRQINLLRLINY